MSVCVCVLLFSDRIVHFDLRAINFDLREASILFMTPQWRKRPAPAQLSFFLGFPLILTVLFTVSCCFLCFHCLLGEPSSRWDFTLRRGFLAGISAGFRTWCHHLYAVFMADTLKLDEALAHLVHGSQGGFTVGGRVCRRGRRRGRTSMNSLTWNGLSNTKNST